MFQLELGHVQPLTRVSALFHRLSITFHDQKLRKHIKNLMGQMGDVGVPRNQALIIFANCFQVKSSYKLSRVDSLATTVTMLC